MRHLLLICILLIFNIFTSVFSQTPRVKFHHITISEGLSQNSVYAILRDSKGFMWFGTLDGLNKYDGIKITEYRNKIGDTSSIADNSITALLEDKNGVLWIGTENKGICLYNRLTNKFTNIKHDPVNKTGPLSDKVKTIYQDNDGYIWIGTDRGVSRYDKKANSYIHYSTNEDSPIKLSGNSINKIYRDPFGEYWIATNQGIDKISKDLKSSKSIQLKGLKDAIINTFLPDYEGFLWIGTNNGLVKYDISSGKQMLYQTSSKNLLSSNKISSLVIDTSGVIWIGTEGGGLNRFDIKTETFSSYINDAADPFSISVNHILSLCIDKTNILWVGTYLGGINKWNRSAENISLYRQNLYDPKSLSSNQIRSIYQDRQGTIWIGSVDEGLNRWDRNDGRFIHFKNNPNDAKSLSNNHVRDIFEDSKNNFWVGTDGGGLNLMNRKTGKFERFQHSENDTTTLSNDKVWCIYEDKKGNLWIGTNGGGLNLFDYTTKTFKHFRYNSSDWGGLSSDNVSAILEDQSGKLWVGTLGGGLNIYNEKTQSWDKNKHNENNKLSLADNRIYCLYEDREGILWIGMKGGLNKYDPATKSFILYDDEKGLPNNVIVGILEDNQGNLWLSTNKGISKFDKKEAFRNYDVRDGLQSNEFLVGSYCKTKDGEMLVGGVNGFNSFFPEKLRDNPHIPEIVISGFQVYNKDSQLDTFITEKYHIELEHFNNFVSFDFVALDYMFPDKNEYAYKLEGFETTWNKVKNRKFANYTGLEPGQYTFWVTGSNNDGIWNKTGRKISLIIHPAFWQTLWFKGLIVVLIIIGILVSIQLRISREKRRRIHLEHVVKLRTAEVVRQKEEIEEQSRELEIKSKEIEIQRDEATRQRDIASQQRDLIGQQKKEMMDSIIYAKRIQFAILPNALPSNKIIKDYFILFKPKDIVSGDFYWISRKNEKIIICAADCTGHGVPGAFMSMLGISFLNKIVNEMGIVIPHEILNKLRENIIAALQQKGVENEARDGMDISLITIDENERSLQFSGANNPLYIIRNAALREIKGDQMPIAIYDDMSSFTTFTTKFETGDIVYLFSDGYADQFGGPKGKKFKYQTLMEMLLKINNVPMLEQKEILDRRIIDWMGENEQIDDILLMGYKAV